MKRLLFLLAVFSFAQSLQAGSVVRSRHDLSAMTSTHVCAFCHTPEGALGGLPRWSGPASAEPFTAYGSPRVNVAATPPRVASRVCLSCHDGVAATYVAHGNIVSARRSAARFDGGGLPDKLLYPNCNDCATVPFGWTPGAPAAVRANGDWISMPYPTFSQVEDYAAPPAPGGDWNGSSPNDVKFYAGGVECGSCHNVHDPGPDGHFLRTTMSGSRLCFTCHKK